MKATVVIEIITGQVKNTFCCYCKLFVVSKVASTNAPPRYRLSAIANDYKSLEKS